MRSINQFKSKSKSELQQELIKTEEQLQKMRFDLSFNKLKNVKAMLHARKDIARIKTLLNEK